jgi:hypothetical protein
MNPLYSWPTILSHENNIVDVKKGRQILKVQDEQHLMCLWV